MNEPSFSLALLMRRVKRRLCGTIASMGRALWALPCVAAAGCSAIFGLDPAPRAADANRPSCPIGNYDLCANQQPAGAITFSSATTINTSLDCNFVLFDAQGGSSCAIYATDIDIAVSLTAFGPRPLVLVATGGIHVEG